ncbi:hypothetical protein LSAT2_032188 [Lamellibrachia satsuma]|nr:hypothetical protein LSAT2_032188 [Lamellibrachia satsuma]
MLHGLVIQIQDLILDEVRYTRFYAVLADEVTSLNEELVPLSLPCRSIAHIREYGCMMALPQCPVMMSVYKLICDRNPLLQRDGHCLNLVIGHSDPITHIRNTMDILKQTFVFFNSSSK